MASLNDGVAELLMDVALSGAAVIDKRKLLWMMGKGQDRPTAWATLLDVWEEVGMKRGDLDGIEVFGNIVLTRGPKTEIVSVKKWADE